MSFLEASVSGQVGRRAPWATETRDLLGRVISLHGKIRRRRWRSSSLTLCWMLSFAFPLQASRPDDELAAFEARLFAGRPFELAGTLGPAGKRALVLPGPGEIDRLRVEAGTEVQLLLDDVPVAPSSLFSDELASGERHLLGRHAYADRATLRLDAGTRSGTYRLSGRTWPRGTTIVSGLLPELQCPIAGLSGTDRFRDRRRVEPRRVTTLARFPDAGWLSSLRIECSPPWPEGARLQVHWDDEVTPSIDWALPGSPPLGRWEVGEGLAMDPDGVTLRLPMPFGPGTRITFVHEEPQPVRCELGWTRGVPVASSMRLQVGADLAPLVLGFEERLVGVLWRGGVAPEADERMMLESHEVLRAWLDLARPRPLGGRTARSATSATTFRYRRPREAVERDPFHPTWAWLGPLPGEERELWGAQAQAIVDGRLRADRALLTGAGPIDWTLGLPRTPGLYLARACVGGPARGEWRLEHGGRALQLYRQGQSPRLLWGPGDWVSLRLGYHLLVLLVRVEPDTSPEPVFVDPERDLRDDRLGWRVQLGARR